MHAGDGAADFAEEKSAFDVILPGRDSARGLTMAGWNVRSVGFIAKPEKTHELQTCISESVNNLLRQVPGFLGAIVLHSKHEERNLLVLTFWETEMQAANNHWEEFQAVRKVLSPIVDVCTKVQTFRATVPPICATTNSQRAGEVC